MVTLTTDYCTKIEVNQKRIASNKLAAIQLNARTAGVNKTQQNVPEAIKELSQVVDKQFFYVVVSSRCAFTLLRH